VATSEVLRTLRHAVDEHRHGEFDLRVCRRADRYDGVGVSAGALHESEAGHLPRTRSMEWGSDETGIDEWVQLRGGESG